MDRLLSYLASIEPGPITETAELERALAASWGDGIEIVGSNQGMTAHKLIGRMEDAVWDPPTLTFAIERHGAVVRGSSRAELQKWAVNIEGKTAECVGTGRGQLYPIATRVNVRPIAEEVAQQIIARQEDERLKWQDDGSVRVQIGMIFPAGSVVKQTLEGRRKRFRTAMDELLENAGWKKVRTNVYTPPPDLQDAAAESE